MLRSSIAAALFAAVVAACGPPDAASADGRGSLPSSVATLGTVDDFALLDQAGRLHRVSDYADHVAVALLVQGNACPIVRNTLPAWRSAREIFEPRGIAFLMLNANPQDDRESVAEEVREFDIGTPILMDDAQFVSRSLGIVRTAEVLVFTPRDRQLVYRGPVDDRLGYETQKPEATTEHLADALDALLDGRPVPAADAEVRGCLITDLAAEGDADAPSYARDVAPILIGKCGDCHRENGVGPWSLDDHDTVRGWSAMIRETILTRRMPPWHADPQIGTFANDRSLSPEQARTLLRWIDAGAPRGEGEDPLPAAAAAAPTSKWALGEPDLVLTVPEQRLPATGLVEYRHEDIEIPIDRDVWVVAAVLQPGNPSVLHHGFAILERPDRPRRRWMEAVLGRFTPGAQAQWFPEGSGVLVPAGSRFRMQMHYTTTGKPEVDRSEVGLYFADEPPGKEYLVKYVVDNKLVIPPGAQAHRSTRAMVFEEAALLHALRPHMHYRGRSASFEAHYPDGSTEMLLSVPDYRFTWQGDYTFDPPRRIPAGTRIICSATFDNSALNPDNPDPTAEVRWGLDSIDEMYIGHAYYTLADD